MSYFVSYNQYVSLATLGYKYFNFQASLYNIVSNNDFIFLVSSGEDECNNNKVSQRFEVAFTLINKPKKILSVHSRDLDKNESRTVQYVKD